MFFQKDPKQDMKNFARKIILRGHFYDNNENQQAEEIVIEPVIKCRSRWEPMKNHHNIESSRK